MNVSLNITGYNILFLAFVIILILPLIKTIKISPTGVEASKNESTNELLNRKTNEFSKEIASDIASDNISSKNIDEEIEEIKSDLASTINEKKEGK